MSEKNTVSFLRLEAISTLRWPVKIDEYTWGDRYFDSLVDRISSARFCSLTNSFASSALRLASRTSSSARLISVMLV